MATTTAATVQKNDEKEGIFIFECVVGSEKIFLTSKRLEEAWKKLEVFVMLFAKITCSFIQDFVIVSNFNSQVIMAIIMRTHARPNTKGERKKERKRKRKRERERDSSSQLLKVRQVQFFSSLTTVVKMKSRTRVH